MSNHPIALLPLARPALIERYAYDLFVTPSHTVHRFTNGTLGCTPTKPRPQRGRVIAHEGGPEVVTTDGVQYRTGLRPATCHRCNKVNWK